MNRQEAQDRYGDPEKAEDWACVMVARAAPQVAPPVTEPTPDQSQGATDGKKKLALEALNNWNDQLPQFPQTFDYRLRLHINVIRICLAPALSAPVVRGGVDVLDGWKLVPIEPTEEMDKAPYCGKGHCSSSWCSCDNKKIYKAMIAAAPQQPPAPQPQADVSEDELPEGTICVKVCPVAGNVWTPYLNEINTPTHIPISAITRAKLDERVVSQENAKAALQGWVRLHGQTMTTEDQANAAYAAWVIRWQHIVRALLTAAAGNTK